MTESQIKAAFERMLQKLAPDRAEMIRNLQEVQQIVSDVSGLEAEKARLQAEREAVSELLRLAIRQNASVAQDQDEYNERYDKLASDDADLVDEIGRIDKAISEKRHNNERIGLFIQGLLTSAEVFTEELWCTMVEKVTVFPEGKTMFTLTCGKDIEA